MPRPSTYAFYVLTLALAVPLFYFLSAFLLFKVEKPLPEPETRPSLPPLFANQSLLADGTSIDDELVFRSDVDYKSDFGQSPASSAPAATHKSPIISRITALAAMAVVIPSSAAWLAFQGEFMREYPLVTTSAPYMFPGAFIVSSLLTGFFSDFFFTFARPWWVFMAGIVGCLSHLLIAFFPSHMWVGQQILQGAVISCALVRGKKTHIFLFLKKKTIGWRDFPFVSRIWSEQIGNIYRPLGIGRVGSGKKEEEEEEWNGMFDFLKKFL